MIVIFGVLGMVPKSLEKKDWGNWRLQKESRPSKSSHLKSARLLRRVLET